MALTDDFFESRVQETGVCLFLHMEFVCTWGDYKFPVVPFRRDPLQTGTMRLYPRHRTDS